MCAPASGSPLGRHEPNGANAFRSSAAALTIGVGAFILATAVHLSGALLRLATEHRNVSHAVCRLSGRACVRRAGIHLVQRGGYLIDKLYPDGSVFIDGRAGVYGPGLVRDYVTIVSMPPGWEEILDRYRVSAVLMPPRTRLSLALRQDPGWQEVVVDSDEDLFLRR